jgi:hypothetical protein
MGCDEYIEAREEGYGLGYKDGHDELSKDLAERPGAVFALVQVRDWQDWFDRLKAEAARLGVRV